MTSALMPPLVLDTSSARFRLRMTLDVALMLLLLSKLYNEIQCIRLTMIFGWVIQL